MKFWDVSAVIPLCLIERQSKVLKNLVGEDEAIEAWWGTSGKCFSALARLRREDALTEIEEEQARFLLRTLQRVWTEVEPTNVVREQAGRAVRLHLLRGADALQLAAALVRAIRVSMGLCALITGSETRHAGRGLRSFR